MGQRSGGNERRQSGEQLDWRRQAPGALAFHGGGGGALATCASAAAAARAKRCVPNKTCNKYGVPSGRRRLQPRTVDSAGKTSSQ